MSGGDRRRRGGLLHCGGIACDRGKCQGQASGRGGATKSKSTVAAPRGLPQYIYADVSMTHIPLLGVLCCLSLTLAVPWNETVVTTYGAVQGFVFGQVLTRRVASTSLNFAHAPRCACPPDPLHASRRLLTPCLQVIHFSSIPYAAPPVGNLRFAVRVPNQSLNQSQICD